MSAVNYLPKIYLGGHRLVDKAGTLHVQGKLSLEKMDSTIQKIQADCNHEFVVDVETDLLVCKHCEFAKLPG